MKKKTRNVISMYVAMLMLTAGMLTACSNSKTEETTAVEGTEQVGEPAQDNATVTETSTEQDQENEDTVASENVEESASEKENEGAEETETQSVVYEGIDMDSTLPGLEWIETFNGVIEEPKFVIFNDETNKKVIVENGQEVEFCDTDVFAVFFPLEKSIVRAPLDDNITFCKNSTEKNIHFYNDLFPTIKNGDKILIKQKLEVDGEALELSATLVISGR